MTGEISEFFWGTIFKIPRLRRRLAFQVKYRCLAELDLRVALGHDVLVPWFDEEIGSSFAEIFLEQEYSSLFSFIKPPGRWIDFGAFAGIFSIWLVWMGNRLTSVGPPSQALLIDADRRRAGYIADLLQLNRLAGRFQFRHGAIDAGGGSSRFIQKPYMSSALASIPGPIGQTLDVPILTAPEIVALFEPPYDLVKVDIEGAEYQFLQHYRELLCHCEHLLLEWHSWHSGGGGLAQLEELANLAGFDQVAELQPARKVRAGLTGIVLFRRRKPSQIATSQ
jgi:FkbM family methyltransferase